MKRKILLPVFAILLILISCTKDNSIIQKTGLESDNVASGKFVPTHSSGVMGTLTPVPLFAVIKIYNERAFSAPIDVNPDGSFKSRYLPPSVYNMRIYYIPVGDTKFKYLDVNKVEVFADSYTDLGQIKLPF